MFSTSRVFMCLSLFVVAVVAMPVQANHISNGSFETGKDVTGFSFANNMIDDNGTDLPSWDLNGDDWAWYFDNTSGYGLAQEGVRFINVSEGNYIQQAFAVNAGTTYTVSYYEALRQDGAGNGDTLTTSILLAAGSATGTTSQVANNSAGNNLVANWALFTFDFTPDTTTTATLRFDFNEGSGLGYTVIDNVTVAPEPSSVALTIVGMLGMTLLRRKHK